MKAPATAAKKNAKTLAMTKSIVLCGCVKEGKKERDGGEERGFWW